jgi:predicted nucleic acid-binding protein
VRSASTDVGSAGYKCGGQRAVERNRQPGKIIDLALENRFQVVYDDRILSEYEDVLARPELRIRPARARAVIAHIELTGQEIDATASSSEDGFQNNDDLPFA